MVPTTMSCRTCLPAACSISSPIPNTKSSSTLTDPDGAAEAAPRVVKVRTRKEPAPHAGGRVFHVYPADHQGPKQEPAFTGLLGAFYTRANGADWFNAYPPRVEPGDTILVHAGLYKDDRTRYAGRQGLLFDGTYRFRQSGTADKPIAIKAAGDGEVVFDGDGNHVLFEVMAANHLYFEGLTMRNTNVAFEAGHKGLAGAVGLVVKNCRFEGIGRGIYTDWSGSKDFYIADNVFIGKSHPQRLKGWAGRLWQNTPGFPTPIVSELAIKVYGSGHVVAHNYVANFHDGIDHATYGAPDGNPNPVRDRMPVSIDIYNNDVTNVDDNCIEADGAMHNIRVLRNRCFNQAHRALSTQPILGGPAYFVRNVVYHAPESGSVKFTTNSAGILVYHNTFTVRSSRHGAGLEPALPQQPDSGSGCRAGSFHSRDSDELLELRLQRLPAESRRAAIVRLELARLQRRRGFSQQEHPAHVRDTGRLSQSDWPGQTQRVDRL